MNQTADPKWPQFRYQKAVLVPAEPVVGGATNVLMAHVRTVPTTKTDGTLRLRYAPRAPRPSESDGSTL